MVVESAMSVEGAGLSEMGDDNATNLLLPKDAINTKKANERAHTTFWKYRKEKNYGDVNFKKNWSPKMLSLPCHSENDIARTKVPYLYDIDEKRNM